MVGLYIHVPFCRTRCPYCDFVSQAVSGDVPGAFVEAVCREIAAFDGPDMAGTVYVGGGTPSVLSPDALGRTLAAALQRFRLEEPEFTIEANPDDVTVALVEAWGDLGVNRVSLGVQSFDDEVLRYLGRRHDAATARQACACIAERFDNWSMDLIFGARPVEAWGATLEECRRFAPTHVSAYGLTYEPGTPFGARADEAVDDGTWLGLYRAAEAALSEYERYEISNFARPGFECRHNVIYWRNEQYAGFGPGAYSFVDGVRSRNPADLDTYLSDPGRKAEALRLSDAEIRLETVIQHCRLEAGLSKGAYARRFGRDVRQDFGGAVEGLIARGLLEEDANALRPTRQGFELNDEIGLALVGAARRAARVAQPV